MMPFRFSFVHLKTFRHISHVTPVFHNVFFRLTIFNCDLPVYYYCYFLSKIISIFHKSLQFYIKKRCWKIGPKKTAAKAFIINYYSTWNVKVLKCDWYVRRLVKSFYQWRPVYFIVGKFQRKNHIYFRYPFLGNIVKSVNFVLWLYIYRSNVYTFKVRKQKSVQLIKETSTILVYRKRVINYLNENCYFFHVYTNSVSKDLL